MLFPEPIDSDKHHESQDGGLCIDPLDQLGSLPPQHDRFLCSKCILLFSYGFCRTVRTFTPVMTKIIDEMSRFATWKTSIYFASFICVG